MRVACATCASRASSDSTAMISPFFTCWPRLTRISVSTPPVRAVIVTFLSASVRPDKVSLRACGATLGLRHGDAEQLRLAGVAGRIAARLSADLVRDQMARRDPADRGDHKADGDNAARFHFLSRLLARPIPGPPAPLPAVEQHVFRDVEEHRQHRLGVEIRIDRAAPPHAVGDDHQHLDRRADIGIA